MHRFLVLVALGFLVLKIPTAQAIVLNYNGQFSQVETSSSECELIFAKLQYETKHFLVGSNRLTSVVYFVDDGSPGFFSAMSVIGQMGYDNQMRAEKEFSQGGRNYRLFMDGLVDRSILYFQLWVKEYDQVGNEICQAYGEYFGQQN